MTDESTSAAAPIIDRHRIRPVRRGWSGSMTLGGVLHADLSASSGLASLSEMREVVDVVVVVDTAASRDGSGTRPGVAVAQAVTRCASVVEATRLLPDATELVVLADAESMLMFGAHFVTDLVDELPALASAIVRGQFVTDALKRVEGRRLIGSVPRDGLLAPALPQVVRRDAFVGGVREAPHLEVRGVVPRLLQAGHRVRIHTGAANLAPVRRVV